MSFQPIMTKQNIAVTTYSDYAGAGQQPWCEDAWIQAELTLVADPTKATQMQAYCKTDMPMYGIPKPANAIGTPLSAALACIDLVRQKPTLVQEISVHLYLS